MSASRPSNWGGTSSGRGGGLHEQTRRPEGGLHRRTGPRPRCRLLRGVAPAVVLLAQHRVRGIGTRPTRPIRTFQDNLKRGHLPTTRASATLPVVWWQIPEGVPSTDPGRQGLSLPRQPHALFPDASRRNSLQSAVSPWCSARVRTTRPASTTDAGQFQLLDSEYFSGRPPSCRKAPTARVSRAVTAA